MPQTYSADVSAFLDEDAKSMGGGIVFHPTQITLNGQTGKFSVKKWSDEEKRCGEKIDMTVPDWKGVILHTGYFSERKYREGATKWYRTREIADWNDTVELVEYQKGAQGKTIGVWSSYAAFKSANTPIDPMTHEPLASPYELKTVLYIWLPARKETVKLVIRGSGVSRWFDYERKFIDAFTPEDKPRSMKQVLTGFSSMKETNEKSGMEFYSLVLKADGLVDNDTMQGVMSETKRLADWRESWKSSREVPVETVIAVEEPTVTVSTVQEEEIPLDQIPF
ncbi:MAG: hypothetical protein WC763_05110 [Candidatus Paceibacterota bacterium]|jgi:hypothetical protein